MINSTTLADDNVTGNGDLATEYLYTQSFALGITTVLNATFTFFMCHLEITFLKLV